MSQASTLMNRSPGPWRVETEFAKKKFHEDTGEPFVLNYHYVKDARGMFLLLLTSENETCPNARLIAAAPELLEALKLALEQIESAAKPKLILDAHTACRIIREAITKATGGEE
jgi:hypothetical protein